MCRGITVCCLGNYIIHCDLTCQICSMHNVSLSENHNKNKTVIPQQQGSVAAFPVTRHQTLLLRPIPGDQLLGGTARDWAVWSPTAPSPGPNGADWSHFTTGPMQPAEQNRAELVAQGPEAHYKDQHAVLLAAWRAGRSLSPIQKCSIITLLKHNMTDTWHLASGVQEMAKSLFLFTTVAEL